MKDSNHLRALFEETIKSTTESLQAELKRIKNIQQQKRRLSGDDRRFLRQMLHSALVWRKKIEATRLGNRKAADALPAVDDASVAITDDEFDRLEAFGRPDGENKWGKND